MSFGSRYRVTMGPTLTPMVKYLVIGCALTFFLQLGPGREMIYFFGLTPFLILTKLFLWQFVTYLFLHGGFWHLFWNMFALWMFGCELERLLGRKTVSTIFFGHGSRSRSTVGSF